MTAIGVIVAYKSGHDSLGQAFLSHTNHWDAGWYLHVIHTGYSTSSSPATPAFYPLFPSLVALVGYISFGVVTPIVAGLIINTLALWLAIVALTRILRHFTDSKATQIMALFLFLSFPSAFFMHAFYSEAVFIAVAFWAYLFALQRRWWAVGATLAVLTAARLPSFLFVVLCLLEYMRSCDWKLRQILSPKLLWILLAPIGFITYGIYLAIVRHDFLAMFHAYTATSDWTYQIFSPNIFETLWRAISTCINAIFDHHFTYEIFINQLLPLLSIALIILCSIYCLIRLRANGITLFTFGILSVVLFTLNSNIISVHRYALPCLTIYIAFTLFYKHSRRFYFYILFGLSACLQLFLYTKFITGTFAG